MDNNDIEFYKKELYTEQLEIEEIENGFLVTSSKGKKIFIKELREIFMKAIKSLEDS